MIAWMWKENWQEKKRQEIKLTEMKFALLVFKVVTFGCLSFRLNVLFLRVLVALCPAFLHLISVGFFPSGLRTNPRQLCDGGLDLEPWSRPAAAGPCYVCPHFLWINHLVNTFCYIRCRLHLLQKSRCLTARLLSGSHQLVHSRLKTAAGRGQSWHQTWSCKTKMIISGS